MSINFGTDGWRAIISQDFTIDNLKKVSIAISKLVTYPERKELDIYKYKPNTKTSYTVEYRDYTKGVAIGFDNRFMSEYFAKEVAEVLSSQGIPVYLSNSSCSTPALSLKVFKNFAAGVMITASHNPYIYNGVKYKAEYGGSATSQMTKLIEKFLSENIPEENNKNIPKNFVNSSYDFQIEYLETIKQKVDTEKIKNFIEKNNIFIVIDYMYGVLSNSFKYLINSENIIQINNYKNPWFDGGSPEPIPQNLGKLEKIVKMLGPKALGFAFDGDGDRIFATNFKQWITPHEILPLLALHLIKNKKWDGKLVRTLPTSTKLKRLADKLSMECIETPVGFKYIADLFVKDNILIGGEESGGIGFKNHIPERDSLLNALYIIEMMSDLNLKPVEIVDFLHSFTGESYCYRQDIHFKSFEKQKETYEKFIQKKDEIKNIFNTQSLEVHDYIRITQDDKNWIMLRPSGTEPLIRVYSEAKSMDEAIQKVKSLVNIVT